MYFGRTSVAVHQHGRVQGSKVQTVSLCDVSLCTLRDAVMHHRASMLNNNAAELLYAISEVTRFFLALRDL
jgi:hypothetical protein